MCVCVHVCVCVCVYVLSKACIQNWTKMVSHKIFSFQFSGCLWCEMVEEVVTIQVYNVIIRYIIVGFLYPCAPYGVYHWYLWASSCLSSPPSRHVFIIYGLSHIQVHLYDRYQSYLWVSSVLVQPDTYYWYL